MAKNVGNLIASLSLNDDDYKKKIGGAKKYTRDATQSMQGNLDAVNMMKAAGRVVAFTAAIYGAYRSIVSFVSASNKQEDAVNNLNAGLQKEGIYSVALSKNMQGLASQIQSVTTADDTAVLAGQALMINLGHLSEKQIPDATRATIGLSKIMKIDMESAFRLVGRAATGNTQMFSRYGITIDSTMSKSQKFDEVLRIGAGGFQLATAEARTGSGVMAQFAEVSADLGESLGDIVKVPLIPLLKSLKPEIESLTAKIKELVESGTLDVWANRIAFAFEDRLIPGFKKIATMAGWLLGNLKDNFLEMEDLFNKPAFQDAFTGFGGSGVTKSGGAGGSYKSTLPGGDRGGGGGKRLPRNFKSMGVSGESFGQWQRAMERQRQDTGRISSEMALASMQGDAYEQYMERLRKKYSGIGIEMKEFDDAKTMMEDVTTSWENSMADFAHSARDLIGDVFFDWFRGEIKGISGLLSSLGSAVQRSAFRSLANWIVESGGSALGGIFKSAEGNVFTKPAITAIGERGPEAVIPLRNGSVPVVMSGGGGGPIVHNHFEGSTFLSPDIFAMVERIAMNAFEDNYRNNGIMRSMIRGM